MRDYQLQTPQKEHQHANRRSKPISNHAKNHQKISKKCLNSVFALASEDFSLESPKDSIDFSSISEISDDNQIGESPESVIATMNPVLSPSSETVSLSDLTPLSSSITVVKDEADNVSVNRCGFSESNSVRTGPVEAQIVLNHLRQARIQVLNSADADLQSKKLLDALIKVVIDEFYGLPEERDRFAELLSTKTRIVFLSFSLWILAVLAVFLFSSSVQSSFIEPPPT
ncbi:hypothetical protein F0562_034929 [Nyssa sinensis]|uniref:Uncharacterized protein n=1 Tax=Nyssa sinensis TaxID=561372 RepID=A0A5J5AC74_9ASTE|nr:hypothetical protein F0562_034929 [Nyssa sinensis]